MTINEFLSMAQCSKVDFSEKLGCTYHHLLQISNGHRKPGVELARKIEELTGGLVKKEDLIFG